jgi:hypothetical protein
VESCTTVRVVRLGNKNDCPGEAEQQFTLLSERNKHINILTLTHYLNVKTLRRTKMGKLIPSLIQDDMKTFGDRGKTPRILNISIRWRSAISVKLLSLFLRDRPIVSIE